MSATIDPLILDLVAFVAMKPRPYDEVIDAWSSQPYTEHGKSVPLEAGPHALRLEYFEREGHARLTFSGRVEGSRADVSAMLHLPRDIGPLKDACRATSR